MLKSKLVMSLVVTISTIAVGAIVGLVIFFGFLDDTSSKDKHLTADKLVKLSVETAEMTTNLKDNAYAKVQYRILVDNEDAKKELEKRIFQVQNSIIYELANTTSKELNGQKGIKQMEENLKEQINKFLESGKVIKVYTTKKIVQ